MGYIEEVSSTLMRNLLSYAHFWLKLKCHESHGYPLSLSICEQEVLPQDFFHLFKLSDHNSHE